MANIYVRSTDGNNADNGSTWALAKATLVGALAIAVGGDTIYISQSHSESTAGAVALTSAGTAANPIIIVCGNDAAEPPTSLATSAIIATTGANAISFAGFAYCYGVGFRTGVGQTTGNSPFNFTSTDPWSWYLESCSFEINNTNAGTNRINFGASSTSSDDQYVELVDCSFMFGNVAHGIVPRCPIVMRNCSLTGSVFSTILFLTPSAGNVGNVEANGCDFSNLGSGKSLVDVSVGNPGRYHIMNCKLGASVSIVSGSSPGHGGTTVHLINCDSANTNYRFYKYEYTGEISQETTIVRTGGATDGVTPISYKMVTTANSKLYFQLKSLPISFWSTSLNPVTIEVEVVTDNVTLQDNGAWIRVEYPGTSGFPQSVFISDRMSTILSTPADQTTSTVDWTTTGLGTPVKQKLSVSFTPLQIGLIRVYVILARPSTTMYFCPKIVTNLTNSFMLTEDYINIEKINTPTSIFGRRVL